jgi:hypothetical protein
MPAAESRAKRTIPLGRARLKLSDCARHGRSMVRGSLIGPLFAVTRHPARQVKLRHSQITSRLSQLCPQHSRPAGPPRLRSVSSVSASNDAKNGRSVPCPVTGFRPAAGQSAGSSSKAAQCAGRTARKCRWSIVVAWVAPRRSSTAITEASAVPSGKPAYCRTRPGHPGEVLGGGGLDDQFATRQCVEERGLDCGTWLDLEEIGDLGDD